MNIKQIKEELEDVIEDHSYRTLEDEVADESTVRDYIIARTEHIEDSIAQLVKQFPEIEDTDEFDDIMNQIYGLYDLARE